MIGIDFFSSDSALVELKCALSPTEFHCWFSNYQSLIILGYVEVLNHPHSLRFRDKEYLCVVINRYAGMRICSSQGIVVSNQQTMFDMVNGKIIDFNDEVLELD